MKMILVLLASLCLGSYSFADYTYGDVASTDTVTLDSVQNPDGPGHAPGQPAPYPGNPGQPGNPGHGPGPGPQPPHPPQPGPPQPHPPGPQPGPHPNPPQPHPPQPEPPHPHPPQPEPPHPQPPHPPEPPHPHPPQPEPPHPYPPHPNPPEPYPPQPYPPGYNDVYGPNRTVRWADAGVFKAEKFIETTFRINLNGNFVNEVFLGAQSNDIEIRSVVVVLTNGQSFEANNFHFTLQNGQQTRQLFDYNYSLRVDHIDFRIASPNLIGPSGSLALQFGLAY
ncbi:MAG: hypothetical protein ACXVAX_00270 [Pseudobdellovibrio sp.]